MKIKFITVISLLFIIGNINGQNDTFISKKLDYKIQFPAEYSRISGDIGECRINQYTEAANPDKTGLFFSISSTKGDRSNLRKWWDFNKTITYKQVYYVNNRAIYNVCYRHNNMWIIEYDGRLVWLSVKSYDQDYPDLSYVLPFIYSFQFPDGSRLPIVELIGEEFRTYSNTPSQFGGGVSNKILENSFKNKIVINSANKNLLLGHNNIAANYNTNQQQVLNSPAIITPIDKKSELKSEIDINIPSSTKENSNTFAVIIGNEKYDSEIAVSYAINDAQTFHKYVTKTMGVPEEQVHLLTNATYGKMLREIQWINSIAQAFDGEASIIFYYAGHGMPDEQTKESYLLPVDGDASESVTAVSLDKIYKELNEFPTKQATVFLDACFSGAARDGMLASGRGVRIVPKEKKPDGNLVVFSAVSGDQTAHPYESKAHGLFSYYLMKKLQETSGNISYGELSEYIKKEVNRKSVINGNAQTPQVNVSHNIQEAWKEWKFK